MSRAVVRERWLELTEPLEGGVSCFYNDIRGLTTIAYGNLCNTSGEAMALPMVHPDGREATDAEKLAAWYAVHDNAAAAKRGWTFAATLTDLRLTREGMTELALRKFDSNESILAKRLAHWEQMPACAQMAMHSLAWACGAHAHFPRLFSALDVHDYDAAVREVHMNEWTKGPNGETIKNAGLVPRNVANKILMRNAGRIEAYGLDLDFLDWKKELEVPRVFAEENEASQPTVYPSAGSIVCNRSEGEGDS